MDYGPSLPPRLGADHSQHDNTSDQHSGLSNEPTRVTVQMLGFGGSLRWTPAVPWAAVDYQISTMSTSVCTRLAATIERFRIATRTEAKHLITLPHFILVQ